MPLKPTCSMPECARVVVGRGLCRNHYNAARKHGTLLNHSFAKQPRKKSADERFWEKVTKTDECWEWRGSRLSDGYGTFGFEGKVWKAHRYIYTVSVGSIPDGMMVCHRCDNPPCVRPDHLFLGSNDDNIADMIAKGRDRRFGRASRLARGLA